MNLIEFMKRYEPLIRQLPILVEGDHDVSALNRIDIENRAIKINQGKSLESVCKDISIKYKSIIILTDFDRKGIELMKRISSILRSYDVDPENSLWNFIRKNYNIKSVEDLPWLIDKIQSESVE